VSLGTPKAVFISWRLALPGQLPAPSLPDRYGLIMPGAFAGQVGYELTFLRVGPLILLGALFLLVYCAIFTLAAALAAFVREQIAKRFGQSS
jgi:hypothetical protein